MSDAPKEIEALIEMMAKLPGLGPRSARRAVLHQVAAFLDQVQHRARMPQLRQRLDG